MELEGKELGCWCKPSPCHGDILIKLFKERQGTDSSQCEINEDSDQGSGALVYTPSVFTPLRLNGGGDTSPSNHDPPFPEKRPCIFWRSR